MLNDGTVLDFRPYLQVNFDFRAAITHGAVQEILQAPDCDSLYLLTKLREFGIGPKNV